jgi:hypothetical protein
VKANRQEAAIFIEEGKAMGFVNLYPPRGPWPIDDLWGMKTATVILQRSLSPGKNAAFVQYETIRKTRLHVSNFSTQYREGWAKCSSPQKRTCPV